MADSGDPRFDEPATGDLESAGRADGGALIEYREVEFFDAVEDFGVQSERS